MAGPDVGPNCTGPGTDPRIANGIQIFPGSVPIYRGDTLVGGVGVSGDGVDQDDMVAFLGLHNAGVELGGAIGNAPADSTRGYAVAAWRSLALRAMPAGAVRRQHADQRVRGQVR